MTLRWRIALILAAVAIAVGAVAGTSAWLTTSSQLHAAIDDSLRASARALNAVPGPDHNDRDQVPGIHCPPPGSFQAAAAAQIVTTAGTVTACIEGGVALPTTGADTGLASSQVLLRTVTVDGGAYRLLSTPWHDGGTLQIARSLGESEGVLDRLRLELLTLVAITALLAAAIGWVIATRIARPIVRLRNATENIATTLDFTVPDAIGGTGEVRSLAASFTTMVEAVRQSHEKQRRLVSDASHEMRTPLTSLRSNVELLRRIERLPEQERGEVVHDVLEDIDELSHMLGELVDLASDLASTEPTELVALGDVAQTVATRSRRRFGREIVVDAARAAQVMARPRQLERALSNLVDNAVKYSDDSTTVEIEVDGSTVTVRDRGRGIPAGDVERIFDRFYRATDVRSDPGSGLGLSIVEEIVHSHGGTVFAANRDGGGAVVGFVLPVDKSS